jgi:hypothetical protein
MFSFSSLNLKQKKFSCLELVVTTPIIIILIAMNTVGTSSAEAFTFSTVINNGDLIPSTDKNFNSYNQPSINDNGLVVIRARSRGGGGEPVSGIFTRDMLSLEPVQTVTTRNSIVPAPNNTNATFNEFPSFPRIDSKSSMFAFRGQSQPVWNVIDPTTDEIITKIGTSGIYTNQTGTLKTGLSQLGQLSEFSYVQVPNTTPLTKFDQFPGAPSPTDGNIVAFKGNWTDEAGTGKTGVYFRNAVSEGGNSAVQLIADSNTLIPGSTTTFGSTAPPSAASGQVVFLGVDNEENPTEGGIYRSLFSDPQNLKSVISLNTIVPGLVDPITKLGEALSFDGEYVGYWAALGNTTRSLTLTCPTEGNQALLNYCNSQYPDGFTTDVPQDQGIFVTNVNTLETRLVAQTGEKFSDFLFWNFSGRAPGNGEGDEEGDLELARWRSTSFVAVDSSNLVFKALRESIQGIYVSFGEGTSIEVVVETGMLGQVLDPEAFELPITSLGIERDGFRNGQLVINAAMANEESSWAGIYYTKAVPEPLTILGSGVALGFGVLFKRKLGKHQKD